MKIKFRKTLAFMLCFTLVLSFLNFSQADSEKKVYSFMLEYYKGDLSKENLLRTQKEESKTEKITESELISKVLKGYKYRGILSSETGKLDSSFKDYLIIAPDNTSSSATTIIRMSLEEKQNVVRVRYRGRGAENEKDSATGFSTMEDEIEEIGKKFIPKPNKYYRKGYEFIGWDIEVDAIYPGLKIPNEILIENFNEGFIIPKSDILLIAKWRKIEEVISPSQTTTVVQKSEEKVIELKETPLAKLNYKNHFAYMQGYPDGTIKPQGLITRQEVAAIFFRLLDKDYRNKIRTKENNFDDVPKEIWSNKHISTLNNGKIITGYDNNQFRPTDNITRAELTAIAVKFSKINSKATHSFKDIKGHWAEKYIATAYNNKWIRGYSDGNFKPNKYITRVEFVSLVNNLLGRRVRLSDIPEGTKEFSDLKVENTWYYTAMKIATNSYIYEDLEDKFQKWTKLIEVKFEM